MQVSVSEECLGCGACERLCPEAFELVDDKSEAKDPVEATFDEVEEMSEKCPGGAISVTRGREKLPNIVVTDDCMGCGACEKLHPGGFLLIEGKSEPLNPPEITLEEARDAADRCPRSAIHIEERVELEEVLREAQKAGIKGASIWLEEAAEGNVGEKGGAETTPSRRKASPSSNQGTASRSMADLPIVQVVLVVGLVLLSGYLALG